MAILGVTEHGNSAELVTISDSGELLDRRRIDLTHDLPTHPYHHEGSWAVGRYKDSAWARDVTLAEAVELVERVQEAAAAGARHCLAALAENLPESISVITLRACPELPATIEARIRDNRAQTIADTVMYRQALADAAIERGWSVCWYDKARVFEQAAAVSGVDIDAKLRALGKAAGTPWQAKHKLAAAAAIAAIDAGAS